MRRLLLFRIILGFAIFIVLGFVLITVLIPIYNRGYLLREAASSMRKESSSIAALYNENYSASDMTLEEFQLRISDIADYLEWDIYIVSPAGKILVSSTSDTSPTDVEIIDGFDILDFGSSYYTTGRFYGRYTSDMLCVYTSVTRGYRASAYVIICAPLSAAASMSSHLLGGAYMTFVIMLILSAIILLTYIFGVHLPIRQLLKITSAYAGGDFSETSGIHRADEIGALSENIHAMALELDALKSDRHEFISNISHDFRSPLTSIKGYAQAISEGVVPEELREKYLGVIVYESERLEKLTQSLLEINRYDHGGMFLNISSFDLNQLIRQTVLSFEGRSKDKYISFELLLSGHSLYVSADMQKINRVLHNLVDNAVKFSGDHSVITIETTPRNDKVFVSVKDSGIGIPSNALGKIWERFYKTDLSRGKDKSGTGLGLSIVKDIIQAHHENIHAVSTEGVGTAFTFSLALSERQKRS